MFVSGSYNSSFFEILEGSTVAALFHVEELFTVPGIKVDRLDERVDDSVLSMFACAVEAKTDAQVNGGPFWVFLLAIQADLR